VESTVEPVGSEKIVSWQPTWKRWLMILFWIGYGISALASFRSSNRFDALGPISLALVWWLVLRFRRQLQSLAEKINPPLLIKFLLIGLFFSVVVMDNLATSFKGDLTSNLFLNDVMWVGPYIGVLTAWWLLSRFYLFTEWQVFFLYGFKGIIVEQDFLIPIMAWKGQLLTAILTIPLVLVVYGSAVAPVYVALEKQLPRPARKTGWAAMVLGIIFPGILFYGGAALWFKFLKLLNPLFGMKFPL
jgi:hypothetical protein